MPSPIGRRTRARLGAALGCACLATIVGVAQAGGPGGERPPRILELQYYVDLESGYRYNVTATIKGRAERVTARSGSLRTRGRLSGHISPTGPGKSWFFRKRGFVKRVRADLADDGRASVLVNAGNDSGAVRKRCSLNLEPDPDFGDFAGGRCKRLGS